MMRTEWPMGEGREERASRRDMEDAPGTKWQEGGREGRTDGGRERGGIASRLCVSILNI